MGIEICVYESYTDINTKIKEQVIISGQIQIGRIESEEQLTRFAYTKSYTAYI